MAKKPDLSKLDLYGLLGLQEDATDKEILKAYRKQALKCHPDKNPDNPKAAEEFHQLTQALEVLTDPTAKAAYDKILKAKYAAQLRQKHYDSKRKKFKEDLDRREKESTSVQEDAVKAAYNLEKEIERLRREGNTILKQAQEELRKDLERDRLAAERTRAHKASWDSQGEEETSAKIKAKWKLKKGEEKVEGYTKDEIENIFSKYGDVLNVVMSIKKSGTAIIEFASPFAADLAYKNEIGKSDFPLTLSWLSGRPSTAEDGNVGQGVTGTEPRVSPATETVPIPPAYPHTTNSEPLPSNVRDFESLVLMKMRQAEERKRLIEQMMQEDGEG